MADFELPDQQALIDAFLEGLCKESDHEFRGLSDLLARLPLSSRSERDTLSVQRLRNETVQICNRVRNTEEVREKVAAERRRLLHRDGTPRNRCKAEVCYIRSKYVIY
jgi:hypothetical protein